MEQRGGTADGDTPLSARLRVTAHWVLWAAGKGLAILLLALAGGYGMWGACSELGAGEGVSRWPRCWRRCSVQGRMLGRGLPDRRMLGRALTAHGALLPRDHPALRLLQRLLPALRGAVHVVGLPPPRQPPGLRHPLRPRRRLRRLPPPLPLCLPGALRPGGLPAPHYLGTVSPRGGSCAVGPHATPVEQPARHPACPPSRCQLRQVPREGGRRLLGEAVVPCQCQDRTVAGGGGPGSGG